MAEPTLTDQQRHLLRTFRAIVTERQEAEARATASFEAEQQAAGAAFDQASQAAEARLSAVHQAQGEAQALLARVDLPSLGSQVRVQPPSAGPSDDPAQKLALHAARAKEVTASLPGLVEALQSARKQARRRQLVLAAVGVVGLIAAVILVAGAVRDLQEQRTLRQVQATATAEAIVAEATATAEAIIAEATATAEAIAVHATATAVVPVLAKLEEQTGMRMVYVPPGDFTMGSMEGQGNWDERPQHTVYLSAYWIDKTEVTAAQYGRCVKAGACSEPDTSGIYSGPFCIYGDAAASDHPVDCVTWYEAVSYCKWAGKRLPTEAEWEKAARGSDGRIYPWGNSEPSCTEAAYGYCEGRTIGDQRTLPVGSRPSGASPYGALDMAGNIAEWVADWYDAGYYSLSPFENPKGPNQGYDRVVRGGAVGWDSDDIRVTSRHSKDPGTRGFYHSSYGFRCAFSP